MRISTSHKQIMTKEYRINIENDEKRISPGPENFGGINPKGDAISFTNYYMQMNSKPFFGICGEFHFSRCHPSRWEDEILKMKMCKINIIATYIIWIFHEEKKGVFDWAENKNLKYFVELCKKHDMLVIIRIGPFAHAEARNGGIPDWLFGRPFEIRSNDKNYLYYAREFYSQIAKQVKGLLYKDGGPIIATQIENEYMHAGAPSEITTGLKLEWVSAGRDGESHMKKLKEMALSLGIETPFYTCTGWGNAAAPHDEMLPLWGGYAFWPWIFTGDETDNVVDCHPVTRAYIYDDYHNNEVCTGFNFTPKYLPESLPYACCEMGGGMLVFYKYRFILPPESVEAMCNVKVAGGCNFIGYYMFRGGSNPRGKTTPYLNEHNTPKISYDFQAPIGEFGQIRLHYKMLKRLHMFFSSFSDIICPMKTILPWDTQKSDPSDTKTLRFCARVKDGSGFLFINTYQDHVETLDKCDFSITLDNKLESLRIPDKGGISLAKDTSCILPFNLELGGCLLKYSTCQLITSIQAENRTYYFFFVPEKMRGEYCFDDSTVKRIDCLDIDHINSANKFNIFVPSEKMSCFSVTDYKEQMHTICTLTGRQSLNTWKARFRGCDRIMISDANLMVNQDKIVLDYENTDNIDFWVFPEIESSITSTGSLLYKEDKCLLFDKYRLEVINKDVKCRCKHPMDNKAVLKFEPEDFYNVDELFLRIRYKGDIGYAFIDGTLISDNFSNSDVWEIGLIRHRQSLLENGLYIHISPIKKGTRVKRDSMAATREEVDSMEAGFISVELRPRRRIIIE